MRFGIWPTGHQPWDEIVETARHAEATGWDSVWIADHFMPHEGSPFPVGTPTLECLSLVAALAATVHRVRLGTIVLGNTYRHPAVVANMAVTIDHVSDGRFTLGVGTGWQRNEHEAYGIELPPVGALVDRFAEAVQVLYRLLRCDRPTFSGRYYALKDALCEPKPIQQKLPIMIGGSGDRMLRIAAHWGDIWNHTGRPELIAERSTKLTQACEAVGRDPHDVIRTAQAMVFLADEGASASALTETDAQIARSQAPAIAGTVEALRETIAAYAAAGVEEFIVPDRTLGRGQAKRERMDRLKADVFGTFG